MGMQQAAQNLDPQTLAKILAMRKGSGNATGGGRAWWDPNLKTDDPNGYILHNYAGQRREGGDAETVTADPSLDQNFITKLKPNTGGKLGDQWDLDGNYKGTVQLNDGGGRDMNQALAMIIGGYFGGNALNGAYGTGGMSAADAAALDSAMIDMGAGATNVADAGLMEAMGGTTAVGGATTTAAETAATKAAETAATKAATDAGTKAATNAGIKGMNWLDVVNTAATVYGITKAGDASSDATDAAKTVADRQLDLNEESLNWFKQVYADQAPDRTAAAQRANAISDAQLRGMTFATDQAQELDQYNKTTFRPVEQRLVADAQGYDTEGRRESAAQEASGRVASEFDTTRQSAGREMIRYGVDPSTIAALDASSQIDEAKARAGAGNTARTNVEQQGWSRMADVANMGRGIASQQATQQGIATTTGNSSVANSNSALASTQSGNGLMAQGFQNANQGNQIAGSMFNNLANTQRQDDQMLLNGISGVTNYLGNKSYTSSKKVKSNTGRMMDNAKALEQVEDLPVKREWKYDPKKGGPDDGGMKHDGPMAEDAKRVMGSDVAPGGKQIDIQSLNGRMLGAIKELSKRVKALEKHETEPEKEAA